MRVYLRSAQTILRAATLRYKCADQTFYLTQSQYTDTGPTSPSADLITPGAWQGSHWSANVRVTGMTRPRKNPGASGIRARDLPLSRWTPYHYANEAVYLSQGRYQIHTCIVRKELTLSSSFPPISSFAILPDDVFCFHCDMTYSCAGNPNVGRDAN